MIPTDHLVPFVLASFVLVLIPGPSVLFVISRTLVLGRRGGLVTVIGNGIGVFVQVVAVALGVGALVAGSAELFSAIKLVGAAYIVYLGIQAIRHRTALSTVLTRESAPKSTARVLREGFVVGVANPKLVVFFAAVLPQFVDRSAGRVPLQLLTLGAIFVAIALICDSGYALVAGTARAWFSRSPDRLARLGGGGGLIMIGLGASVALSGRPD